MKWMVLLAALLVLPGCGSAASAPLPVPVPSEHRQYVYVTDTKTPPNRAGPFEPVESEPDTPISVEVSPVLPRASDAPPVVVEPYIPPGVEVDNTPVKLPPYMPFSDYLYANLSPDDYSNFDNYESRFEIWCINEEHVRRVAEAYDGEGEFDITYKQAHYSRTVQLALLEELYQLPELTGLVDRNSFLIRGDGVLILTGNEETLKALTAWHANYPKKDYVTVELFIMPAPTNPS